jgi:hypothetical protein
MRRPSKENRVLFPQASLLPSRARERQVESTKVVRPLCGPAQIEIFSRLRRWAPRAHAAIAFSAQMPWDRPDFPVRRKCPTLNSGAHSGLTTSPGPRPLGAAGGRPLPTIYVTHDGVARPIPSEPVNARGRRLDACLASAARELARFRSRREVAVIQFAPPRSSAHGEGVQMTALKAPVKSGSALVEPELRRRMRPVMHWSLTL